MSCAESQILHSDPPDCEVRNFVQFRLVYAGPLLKSAGNTNPRAWEKHALRGYMHSQLKNLWDVHPALIFYGGKQLDEGNGHFGPTLRERLAKDYERCGIGFIPLATKSNGLLCELDVLFLRPERPGRLVGEGGDIDNRMKLLMDALRLPDSALEMPKKDDEEPDPNPMYCLLQDDSLVTSLKVTTDRLLLPITEGQNDALVIVDVNLKAIDPFASPYELHF